MQIRNGATGAVMLDVTPFEDFTGGVFLAVADINGDGIPDLAISPDKGGGPRVTILDGRTFQKVIDFFGIDDPNFRGGARTAFGDVNGDGVADLIVAAGIDGGPRVAVYDGKSLASGQPKKLFNDFFAFEQTLRNGVFIAVGDLDGDGRADIVAGGGPGGSPRVFAISGRDLQASGGGTLTAVANFFAGDESSRLGVRVTVKDRDGDNRGDLITAAVGGSTTTVYPGLGIAPAGTPAGFDLPGDFLGGVRVG